MKRRLGESTIVGGVDEHDPELVRLEKEREEATKVKNISRVVLGRYEIDTWYFSPYPLGQPHADHLYVCDYCLKYMLKETVYNGHRERCPWRHPPGQEIYRKDGLSVWEMDGRSPAKLFCQNLCLLAKLFLDHKTLYFGTDGK
jgi:histone acetyltransferase MYST1